ncbi:hypothetical protein T12_1654 [Trichinella patagoniensis]|uniref:Protein quiver n=1 Tax=Trichinella patagoniensis TaxID=990121 RepID=A0A0V1A031_9BILA|nr:hypothetical protein T12_1654 [Trichinella patagoniensis]
MQIKKITLVQPANHNYKIGTTVTLCGIKPAVTAPVVWQLILPVFCAESSAATTTSVSENGAPFRCYTCLGRDFDNCQSGSVQCAGTCWKIIDQEHELIAKGCTAEQKEDGTEEQNLNTRVQLPWTKDLETIRGVIYYCTGDFCNGARELSIALPLLGFSLMLSYLTVQFFSSN